MKGQRKQPSKGRHLFVVLSTILISFTCNATAAEELPMDDGDTIQLLPAWPKDWDVDFKLHAPKQTVVEGRFLNGKLEPLKVTPVERKEDMIINTK